MSSPYQPYGDATPAATPSGSSRVAAILAHLSAPIAALLSAGSLSLLGPLLVWLLKKDDPYARRAAAGAFNFNLTFWLLYLVSWLLIFTVIGAVVGIPLIIVPVPGVGVVPHQGRDPGGRRPALRLPVPDPRAVLSHSGHRPRRSVLLFVCRVVH